VNEKALRCLKHNYEGNAHLDKGDITKAIQSYDKALAAGYEDQEGVLLVMRATAYLQRAFHHRKALKTAVQSLKESVEWTTTSTSGTTSNSNKDDNQKSSTSSSSTTSSTGSDVNNSSDNNKADKHKYSNEAEYLVNKHTNPATAADDAADWNIQLLLKTANDNPPLAPMLLQRLVLQSNVQARKFQQTKFRHSLYEYALLHATQDSLRSTQLLPRYAKTWLRAGDSLAELRKLKESLNYYEKALELDPSLEFTLRSTIDRLRDTQHAIDDARETNTNSHNNQGTEWPDDNTLRVLTLDVPF
jgi:tetratricopeptide (TPR) repeat protein